MINHKLLFLILALVAILLASCSPTDTTQEYADARRKSVDACIAQGGVPIISSWGNWMTDCKFPTKEIKK